MDTDLQPFVAIIARNADARSVAQRALGKIARLTEEQWQTAWIPLDLDDFMIRVYLRESIHPADRTVTGSD